MQQRCGALRLIPPRTATQGDAVQEAAEEGRFMPIVNRIAEFQAELMSLRHSIHTQPKTASEEHKIAERVAEFLEASAST